jgi:cobalt-zinc-cadmium efflux system membrane fusion protein
MKGFVPALLLVVGLAIGSATTYFVVTSRTPVVDPPTPASASSPPPGTVELKGEALRNADLQIAPAAAASLTGSFEVTGIVAPEESKVAHVRPLARGLIEEVRARLGDRVSEGEPLVVYDNIELGELIGGYLAEAATLRQTQADLAVRQQSLARAEELIKLEGIAQQTLELRRAEAANADAAVASQRARLANVEEKLHRFGLTDADLARLRPGEEASPHRSASHNTLRAPFSGVITKSDVAQGELVEPDRELFTLANLSTVWVLADVYEKDMPRVTAGRDVTMTVDAYPGRAFVGRLTYVSDLVDPATRTVKVRCVVPNTDGALKLDMFARVTIPTAETRQAITVPIEAVQTVDNVSIVFVRIGDSRFERRNVTLGATTGNRVEVVSGVKPGEAVVGRGSFYLKTTLLRERVGGEG